MTYLLLGSKKGEEMMTPHEILKWHASAILKFLFFNLKIKKKHMQQMIVLNKNKKKSK